MLRVCWFSGCLQSHETEDQTLADQALRTSTRWWNETVPLCLQTQAAFTDVPPKFLALWQMTGHLCCLSNNQASFLHHMSCEAGWQRVNRTFPQQGSKKTTVWQTHRRAQSFVPIRHYNINIWVSKPNIFLYQCCVTTFFIVFISFQIPAGNGNKQNVEIRR